MFFTWFALTWHCLKLDPYHISILLLTLSSLFFAIPLSLYSSFSPHRERRDVSNPSFSQFVTWIFFHGDFFLSLFLSFFPRSISSMRFFSYSFNLSSFSSSLFFFHFSYFFLLFFFCVYLKINTLRINFWAIFFFVKFCLNFSYSRIKIESFREEMQKLWIHQ